MPRIQMKRLNKGHQRKLTALRKSLGNKIADEAFSEWLKKQTPPAPKDDPHFGKLERFVNTLVPLGLKIPPGGLKITRGRGGSIKVSKIESAPLKKPRAKKKAAKN